MKSYFIAVLWVGLLFFTAFAQHDRYQPVPTYVIEVRKEKGSSVQIEGSYWRPDGKLIEIESYHAEVPVNLYMNADCHLKLKIEGTFTVSVFYVYEDYVKWLATAEGIPDVPVTCDLQKVIENRIHTTTWSRMLVTRSN